MKQRSGPRRARPKILRGEMLWRALGFRNERAFQRARQDGKVGVRLYPIPHSKGIYALAKDVEEFNRRKNEMGVTE